ncbi:MAG: YeeE/YedE family protein, partial [Rhodomicrobium sp.]|nr:YeeE/YedE family protein [Rhodomicrobium sp.]
MDTLRDTIAADTGFWLPVGGLIIGIFFGAIVQATNFCTMGSISDMLTFGDSRRFRAWVLAAALALLGAQILVAYGLVPISKSMYLAPTLNWAGNIVGGLLFGFGMVLAGGCASRNLVRVGSGDMRSLVNLLVVGIFAYIAIGGLLGPVRASLESATAIPLAPYGVQTQGAGDLLAAAFSLPPASISLWVGVVIAGVFIVWCFASKAFATSPKNILSAIGIAASVLAGWILTGFAYDDMAATPVAPISLTYVRPTGDAIEYLQRYTARATPGFGVASVAGAILGAFLVAIATGRFHFSTFASASDMMRNLGGAVLMGVGGVMALGCTIGQAVTGVSTLAVGSFIT